MYSHGLLIYLCSSVSIVTFLLTAFVFQYSLVHCKHHLVYFLEANQLLDPRLQDLPQQYSLLPYSKTFHIIHPLLSSFWIPWFSFPSKFQLLDQPFYYLIPYLRLLALSTQALILFIHLSSVNFVVFIYFVLSCHCLVCQVCSIHCLSTSQICVFTRLTTSHTFENIQGYKINLQMYFQIVYFSILLFLEYSKILLIQSARNQVNMIYAIFIVDLPVRYRSWLLVTQCHTRWDQT